MVLRPQNLTRIEPDRHELAREGSGGKNDRQEYQFDEGGGQYPAFGEDYFQRVADVNWPTTGRFLVISSKIIMLGGTSNQGGDCCLIPIPTPPAPPNTAVGGFTQPGIAATYPLIFRSRSTHPSDYIAPGSGLYKGLFSAVAFSIKKTDDGGSEITYDDIYADTINDTILSQEGDSTCGTVKMPAPSGGGSAFPGNIVPIHPDILVGLSVGHTISAATINAGGSLCANLNALGSNKPGEWAVPDPIFGRPSFMTNTSMTIGAYGPGGASAECCLGLQKEYCGPPPEDFSWGGIYPVYDTREFLKPDDNPAQFPGGRPAALKCSATINFGSTTASYAPPTPSNLPAPIKRDDYKAIGTNIASSGLLTILLKRVKDSNPKKVGQK